MLDHRHVLLRVLCAGDCVWFYLKLVLGSGGVTLGSAAVDNRCDRRRGCNLGGGGGSTLGGGILLFIGGSTLGGGAGLWVGGFAGGLCVCSSFPSVSCISFVITPLLVGFVGSGGGAILLKLSWRHSNALMGDYWSCGGILHWMDDAILAAAAMMAYSGVDVGLVIYLCLKKKTLIFLVYVFTSPTGASSNSVRGKCPGRRP